jgi:hypothetical protein
MHTTLGFAWPFRSARPPHRWHPWVAVAIVASALLAAFAMLSILGIALAEHETDVPGQPLIARVKDLHGQLEATGLACSGLDVYGPGLDWSYAAGLCWLDKSHRSAALMIRADVDHAVALRARAATKQYPLVVGRNFDISLPPGADAALLRDIARRLNARCVGCG